MEIQNSALAVWRGAPVTVTSAGGDKISVTDASGAVKSVRPKDIEVLHPGPFRGGVPADLPVPDWREIMELAGDETLDFSEWVELAWGEWSPASAWNGFQILQEKFYWEGAPAKGVKARSQEEINAAMAKKQAKDAKKEAFNALVKRIAAAELLPEDEVPMREIFAVARGEREKSALLEALGVESSPIQAHRLLLRCGAADDTFNPHPARYQTGYPGRDTEAELATDGIFTGEATRFSASAVAIDAASSNDPDDALSPEADGSLWVHVADPADIVADGSAAETEAMKRGATLYLPEGIVPMLPGKLVDICGLGLQEKSHALSLHIDFNADGSVYLKEFCRTELSVNRMTYEEAENLTTDPAWLAVIANLEKYNEYRTSRGGVELTLPEFDIFVDRDFNITLAEVVENTGRRLVRNAMVAAGNAVASWAEANGVAMPFVSQSYSDDAPEWGVFGGTWVESFERRIHFMPSTVSALPGTHTGLGIEPYVRVTSPLRRYEDLLAHRQLLAVLDGRETLSADEIERRLCYSAEGAKLRRNAERDSKAHWLSVYLNRLGEWQGRAVKLGDVRDKSVFLLPELGLETRTRWGAEIVKGTECTAVFKGADIPEREYRFEFR